MFYVLKTQSPNQDAQDGPRYQNKTYCIKHQRAHTMNLVVAFENPKTPTEKRSNTP